VENSAILFTAATSGLELIGSHYQTSGPWVVRDLGLYCKFAGCTGPGLTVGYTTLSTNTVAGSVIAYVDIAYDPRESIASYYWNAGMELINAKGARIDHPFIYGQNGSQSGTAILLTGDCTPGPRIVAPRLYFWNKGITKGETATDVTEGTRVISPIMVRVNYGVYFDNTASGGEPGLIVHDGHISSSLGGVVGIESNQISVTGILFYRDPPATGTYADISLTNCTTFSVIGNTVGTTGTSGTETFLDVNNSTYGTIDGNTIQGTVGKRTIGVDFDSTSASNVVGPSNQWEGATTAVVDAKIDPRDNQVVTDWIRQYVVTTNATVTVVNPSMTLNDASVYLVEARVVGVQSDGTNRAGYYLTGVFYRTAAGNATAEGAVTVLHTAESNAAWNATINVASTNVRVVVTGAAATTIKWYCECRATKVSESL
jgi:hypothetical protein